MIVAASLPRMKLLVQLATSFAVSGPPAAIPMGFTTKGAATSDHPAGTMIARVPNTAMGVPQNLAKFRNFQKSAWKTQTGRAGSMFTWCIGNPACTKVSQGGAVNNRRPLIVKYNPGPNRFGGTMGHVITAGPNPSSLAGASPAIGLFFLNLPGMGSQPTGRGYADHLTDFLKASKHWKVYMTAPVYQTALMSAQNLITMVTAASPGGPSVVNHNYGFPFTTGTVIVRNTGHTAGGSGKYLGDPLVVTLTAKGKDSVTAMGARNISLVAGALSAVPAPFQPGESLFETPTLVQIMMPEPSAQAQWWTGAIALLAIAFWRARRPRS